MWIKIYGGADVSIKENYERIKQRVEEASRLCGRNPDDVTIMAVTKTVPCEKINEAIDLGITTLGENRVQELIQKYDKVKGGCTWHLIGSLQTNKVKYIADKVSMIHSVDSVKLAKEISKQCKKINKVMDILIEVNVSGEESKHGISPDQVYDFIEEIKDFENICISGFMTMAPFNAPKEEIHEIFANLYKLYVDISQKKYDNINMRYLSMGMSSDFEIAVLEGANIIRIGTSLFKD